MWFCLIFPAVIFDQTFARIYFLLLLIQCKWFIVFLRYLLVFETI